MEFKDYYKTLGLARDASADELKKAFRKLARKYHPDVSKEPDAERHMQEVNEAYAVLSDPEKRAAYDQLGHSYQSGQDFRPPPDWDSNFEFSHRGFSRAEATDFSDFFAELFGRTSAHPHAFHPRGSKARGEDHHARVLLEIEDSFTAPSRQISLRVPRLDEGGRLRLDTRTLNVRIPKGVHEGQVIRLAGQGEPGTGGGTPGDLLLEVSFRPHDQFRVEGRDLHMALPVSPWEAALGAVLGVQLPSGELRLRIPAGTQSGNQLRVRGRGIPSAPPGDLLLDIQVVLPAADTPRARQIYDEMARELAFDPRGSQRS